MKTLFSCDTGLCYRVSVAQCFETMCWSEDETAARSRNIVRHTPNDCGISQKNGVLNCTCYMNQLQDLTVFHVDNFL
jgi:hypothetical protein